MISSAFDADADVGLDRARTTCVKKHHQKRVMDGECTDDAGRGAKPVRRGAGTRTSQLHLACLAVAILKQRGANDATMQQACSIAERQVHNMAWLVNDLLEAARVTQGKIRLSVLSLSASGERAGVRWTTG
jgi:hypothetical protein